MTDTIPPASAYPALPPRPIRPPLDHSAKVGAGIAGAVSFVLLNIGFVLFWVPIVLGFIALIFTTIVRFAERVDDQPDADFRRFAEVVRYLNLDAWAIPLVLVSVLGVAIMVLAVFSSKWILVRRGIARPWAITWAGLGVAVAANTFVGGFLSAGANLTTSFAGQNNDPRANATIALIVVLVVVSFLVTIAVDAAVGWFAMWWMAHVLRPAASAVGTDPRHPEPLVGAPEA